MHVIGVDLSTRKIHYVAIDGSAALAGSWHIDIRQGDGRTPWWESSRSMRRLVSPLVETIERLEAPLVAIERPYGPHRQSIAGLHAILGALLASLPDSVTAMEISPGEMRAELGVAYNAPKKIMHDQARRHVLLESPDAIDAWAAAHAALRLCERACEA